MVTSAEYIEYVVEQVADCGVVRYRKMFGEYIVYINDKPILLVCDNSVFVKILPCLDDLMTQAERSFPYNGAKEHYMLDIDDTVLTRAVIEALEPVTQVPKPRKKKSVASKNNKGA